MPTVSKKFRDQNPHKHLLNDKQCAFITNGVCISSASDKDTFAVTPCCYFDVTTLENGSRERHNNYALNNYLEDVNADPDFTYPKLAKGPCSKCRVHEKTYGYVNIDASKVGETVFSSLRGRAHQRVPERHAPGKIVHLDVMFSNFCNFQCVYCDAYSSSEWNKTAKQLKQIEFPDRSNNFVQDRISEYHTHDNEYHIMEQILLSDLSELRMLYIKGGEPFMIRIFDEFLARLADRCDLSKVTLYINTNNSLFPKDSIIQSFTRMKNVHLRISGESTGALAEYVRYGTKWNEYTNNARKWVQLAKEDNGIQLEVQSAVSVFTVNKWHEWHEWMQDVGLDPATNWPDQVTGEQAFRNLLDKKQAETIYDRFAQVPHAQWSDFYSKQLNPALFPETQDPIYRKHFQKLTTAVEKIRGNTLKTVNPEMFSFLF